MRRTVRFIAEAACIVSFLSLLAAATFCIRAQFVSDKGFYASVHLFEDAAVLVSVEANTGSSVLFLEMQRTNIGSSKTPEMIRGYARLPTWHRSTGKPWQWSFRSIPQASQQPINRLGLHYSYSPGVIPSGTQSRTLLISWFTLLGGLTILPLARGTLFLRRHSRRARWKRNGCCLKCGYDLRATPDRCPECGHVPRQLRETGPERTASNRA